MVHQIILVYGDFIGMGVKYNLNLEKQDILTTQCILYY